MNVFFFGFETMKKDNGICEVYAVGFIHRNKYNYFYGIDSLDKFVNYLL